MRQQTADVAAVISVDRRDCRRPQSCQPFRHEEPPLSSSALGAITLARGRSCIAPAIVCRINSGALTADCQQSFLDHAKTDAIVFQIRGMSVQKLLDSRVDRPKVDRRSLDRRVADALREEILSGRFAPGFRLVETWLAQQLEVSRGTVRAALAELTHQGLVDQVAYTKWSVPDMRAQDAWELYTLRATLEGLGSYLAAEAMSPGKGVELSASFNRLVEAARVGEVGPAVEADLMLHKTIVGLSGHGR